MANTKKEQKNITNWYVRDGLSAKQISEKLFVPESTIRHRLNRMNVKKRSISEAITNLYITKFNKQPFRLKKCTAERDKILRVAGAMLYWGEGTKGGNSVKFANSDPEMIKTFLSFLRNICGIYEPRLKALVHMYPDHDEQYLINFWSAITKIPKSNFYRSYIHEGKKGTYKNKSFYGTIAINYSDKKLLKAILSFIEEYKIK